MQYICEIRRINNLHILQILFKIILKISDWKEFKTGPWPISQHWIWTSLLHAVNWMIAKVFLRLLISSYRTGFLCSIISRFWCCNVTKSLFTHFSRIPSQECKILLSPRWGLVEDLSVDQVWLTWSSVYFVERTVNLSTTSYIRKPTN